MDDLTVRMNYNVTTMSWVIELRARLPDRGGEIRRHVMLPDGALLAALDTIGMRRFFFYTPGPVCEPPERLAAVLFALYLRSCEDNQRVTALYNNTVLGMKKTLRNCADTVAQCNAAMKAAGLDGPVAGMVTTF